MLLLWINKFKNNKMKKLGILKFLAFFLIFTNCAGTPENSSNGVMELTNESFKQKIFDYKKYNKWKFEGAKPVIIDFYANWCGPCHRLLPIIEELAKEYNGKIIFYKVNTDAEQELSQYVNITKLPTMLFIPVEGQPQITIGLLTKEKFMKIINEVLLKNQL